MQVKLRLLLTNTCSARCAYCHNEGQHKADDFLALTSIRHMLGVLLSSGIRLNEVVLSGGEPTLHPALAEIAALCRATGAFISLNSHGAHPGKLRPALPWIDELKIHVDSFDPLRQKQSMGIHIAPVLRSIGLAQNTSGLRTVVNHPLHSISEACAVIQETSRMGVTCKLIELFGADCSQPRLQDLPLAELGYARAAPGQWFHSKRAHWVMTRRCDTQDVNTVGLFLGPDGIRSGLDSTITKIQDMQPPSQVIAFHLKHSVKFLDTSLQRHHQSHSFS